MRQIVTQGGRYSFGEAAQNLHDLARVKISAVHIDNLVRRLGQEWSAKRDREVADFQHNALSRGYAQAPRVAAVMLDAGRAQTRAEPSAPGVESPQWRAPNYACCLSLPAQQKQTDPQPEPPEKFLDRQRVPKLVQELQRIHGTPLAREQKPKKQAAARAQQPKKRSKSKKRLRKYLLRTVVATLAGVNEFAQMVAAEVYKRGLDLARDKACVADGQASNWTVYEEVLRPLGFRAVLDFLHLLGYLYAAAQAASDSAEKKWALYERWLRWAWGGMREKLLLALQAEAARAGQPPEGAPERDPRKVLQTAVRYVTHNLDKMDYPRYRQLGLPISSAPVESLIKQFNRRVKGTEKFWTPSALEAVLQVRAAELSEDSRLDHLWSTPRPRGRIKLAAAA